MNLFSFCMSSMFHSFNFEFLLLYDFLRRAIESDHVNGNEIEIVTSVSETDDGDAYGENDRNIGKTGDGADDDSIDIDYEGSTSDSTNIEHSFSSSSTEFTHIDKCRGDDSVSCPKNPNIRICDVQFCDGINDCPDNEDESNCKQSVWHFLFYFFDSFFFISFSLVFFFCFAPKIMDEIKINSILVKWLTHCVPLFRLWNGWIRMWCQPLHPTIETMRWWT